jgi:hypothetical protein
VKRKILAHINNCNPILIDDSLERAGGVKEAGKWPTTAWR